MSIDWGFDQHFCSSCHSTYKGSSQDHMSKECFYYNGCPKCRIMYTHKMHVDHCRGFPPEERKSENPRGNLALRKPTIASSSENENFQAMNATDGKPLTRWSSQFSEPHWLEVDLEEVVFFNNVQIHWEFAHAASFEIRVSRYGTQWDCVYKDDQGIGGKEDIVIPMAKARYIRIYCLKRSSRWGFSIWSLEVYYKPEREREAASLIIPEVLDTRTIEEQVRESDWWKREVPGSIKVIDERKPK